MKRRLSSWEKSWLEKHGVSGKDVSKHGEMPVEYLTGRAEFYGREFIVNQNVLIARIETEQIIEEVIKFCSRDRKFSIADVGTGSGCIGITLALELLKRKIAAKFFLSDIKKQVLDVTRQNLRKHFHVLKDENKFFRVFLSDLLINYSPLVDIDVVVANLPYIPSRRIPKLPSAVRDFEPRQALDGGTKGTFYINRLLQQIEARKNKPDLVILEIDDTHSLKNFIALPDYRYYVLQDTFGRNRFLKMVYNPPPSTLRQR